MPKSFLRFRSLESFGKQLELLQNLFDVGENETKPVCIDFTSLNAISRVELSNNHVNRVRIQMNNNNKNNNNNYQ